MRPLLKVFTIALICFVTGCAITLRPVSVQHSESLFNYKYFYIQPTGTVNASPSSGVVVGNMVISAFSIGQNKEY